MKTFGTLTLADSVWCMEAEPHVMTVAKRLFQRADKSLPGKIVFRDTTEVARDLEWFIQRYPLRVDRPEFLAQRSRQYQQAATEREELLTGKRVARNFELKFPPREYQSVAAELMLNAGSMLIGDDVGLGKTVTAICVLAQKQCQPAVVVTLTHLPRQWEREIHRFIPNIGVHRVTKSSYYNPSNRRGEWPGVLIVPYSKLIGWRDAICKNCRTVVWDEVQELRRHESQRYTAAVAVADAMTHRFGLSATPVYNYGGEIYNVLRCIVPDTIGTFEEFSREWCDGAGRSMKPKLKDPAAFGSHLKEHHIMLRRTRADVQRELPPLTKITHFVDPDTTSFRKSNVRARELARLLLEGTDRATRFTAAGEFDSLMRQLTGISKAVSVAAFVEMLLQTGQPVLLYGWHRAVYDIWMHELADYNPAIYTGTESDAKKDAELQRFVSGKTDLMIMSLRSGVGVDGLQFRCSTVVFGEFDWSPAVIDQDIGRVARDGQQSPVMAYMLAVDEGADPFMMEVLGLKQDQQRGILGQTRVIEPKRNSMEIMKSLAKAYLENAK